MTIILLSILALAIILLAARIFLFYPAADSRCKTLNRREQAILRAIGEVLLPHGGPISPSADEAGAMEYFDEYLGKIPGRQRTLLRLLLVLMEQGTLVLVPSLRRLSGLPLDAREKYLAGWEESPLYFRRIAFTSLRSLFTMAYLADVEVQKQLGIAEPEVCNEVISAARGRDFYAGVKELKDYKGDWEDSADVIVVGSGPGGAIAARELAERGRSVILVEEGPIVRREGMITEPGESMHRWCREDGLSTTMGNVFLPTISAKCLGGTSVINSAICSRPLPSIFTGWQERHGLGPVSRESLDPFFDRVGKAINVRPTQENIQGRRNLLFRQACDAMGFSHLPMDRAEIDCGGCSECFTGCRMLSKQSVDLSVIPAAIKAGARVYTSVRAEGLILEGKKVAGIRGKVAHGNGGPGYTFTARGKAVVLAAGPTATPLILLKNGVANRSGQVGRNLQFHPGAAIMGIFPEAVDPWIGANQGYQSLQYLEEGIKLEVLWSPLAIIAVRFPGFGVAFKETLAKARYSAPWDAFVRTSHSFGSVKAGGDWRPRMSWDFDPRDAALLQRGLGIIADMQFAAGATSILPGIHGIPPIVKSRDEAQLIKTKTLKPTDFIVAATHVFGTARMGGDPASSVVDSDGKCHDFENLYIADASVLPEGTGVNPMFTVMALSLRTAGIIHDRL